MIFDPKDESIESIVHRCVTIAQESSMPFIQVGDFLNQLEREAFWAQDDFLNLRLAVIRQLYGNYLVEAYPG